MPVRLPTNQGFVHLHNHTEYSFLDSIIKVKGLGQKLKSKGFTSYAITDHGNINGVFAFYEELKKYDIKPIIGCEFYYSPSRFRKGLTDEEKEQHGLDKLKAGERKERTKEVEKELGVNERYHVVVLAKNNAGFKKIMKAVELSHTEGFYRFPRIDYEILTGMVGDCIVLTACVGGYPGKQILKGDFYAAQNWCSNMKKVFGDDFYLEIQPNEMPEQVTVNEKLYQFSQELDIKLVATNDVHYLTQNDWEVHDTLLALRDSQHGKTVLVSDPDRFRYSTKQLYLKTKADMIKSFQLFHRGIPTHVFMEAINNTLEVDSKIENDIIEFRKGVLPDIFTDGKDPDDYFMDLIRQGWRDRKINKKENVDEYKDRVLYEYGIITKLGFAKYFLVIYDLIRWCRENNIRPGPGRGSVGGSLIAYLIGITSVDSILWDCPFSRFITEDRLDYPDIDMDFPTSDRERVKQYLRDKYGNENVSGICTFGRMKGKQTLKDVARVFGVPHYEVDNITKYIIHRDQGEEGEYECIKDSINESPEFSNFADQYPRVINFAIQLEGLCRQIGVHAAGMVTTDKPVVEMCPVQLQRKMGGHVGDMITGWDKIQVEKIGLLKLDILGIDALTYIQKCIDSVKERTGETVEPESWTNYDDAMVWEAFQNGHTELVWQLNQPSAVRVLKQLKPDNIGHIIAANALLRPGPLNSGITAEYINRRHGEESPSLHEDLDRILSKTHGMMVFQEDTLKIAHDMAGFTWSEADKLRKAIGKKRIDKILELKEKFVNGFVSNGYEKELGNKIFDQIQEFSKYGFNLGHSTAYSLLSYWTMYLKLHYPVDFICAALQTETSDAKRRSIIKEAKRLGINVLPPDVNISGENFTIDNERENTIRCGFAGVKGVGQKTLEKVVENRPYTTLEDFILRSGANKSVIQTLLRVGALDTLTHHPAAVEFYLEDLLKIKKRKNFEVLYKDLTSKIWTHKDPNYPEEIRDKYCLEYLALPPQIHLAARAKNDIDVCYKDFTISNIDDYDEIFEDEFSNNYEWFIGTVSEIKTYSDDFRGRQGKSARVLLSDETGEIQLAIPVDVLEAFSLDNLVEDKPLLILAKSQGINKLQAGYIEVVDTQKSPSILDRFQSIKKEDYKGLDFSRGKHKVCCYITGIKSWYYNNEENLSICVIDKNMNSKEITVWSDVKRGYSSKFEVGKLIECFVGFYKGRYSVTTNREKGGGPIKEISNAP